MCDCGVRFSASRAAISCVCVWAADGRLGRWIGRRDCMCARLCHTWATWCRTFLACMHNAHKHHAQRARTGTPTRPPARVRALSHTHTRVRTSISSRVSRRSRAAIVAAQIRSDDANASIFAEPDCLRADELLLHTRIISL